VKVGQKAVVIQDCCGHKQPNGKVFTISEIWDKGAIVNSDGWAFCSKDYLTIGDRVQGTREYTEGGLYTNRSGQCAVVKKITEQTVKVLWDRERYEIEIPFDRLTYLTKLPLLLIHRRVTVVQ
jgi:hypothetical protein